jgi:hypothetical protein
MHKIKTQMEGIICPDDRMSHLRDYWRDDDDTSYQGWVNLILIRIDTAQPLLNTKMESMQ